MQSFNKLKKASGYGGLSLLTLADFFCDPLHPERDGKADDRTDQCKDDRLYDIFGVNIREDSK